MCLVDEENDGRGRGAYFFDQPLEPVFELALDAGAGLQQGEIEGPQAHVAQDRWHLTLHDAHGEALDNGGLPDARFADEDRVVLPSPRENVHDLADLKVPSQDRVERPLPRPLGEVEGVLIEVRRLAAGRTGRCVAARERTSREGILDGALDDSGEVLAQALAPDLAQLSADLTHLAAQLVVGHEREDGVPSADRACPVVHGPDEPCFSEHLGDTRAEGWRPRVARLQLVQAAREVRREPRAIDLELLEDGGAIAIARVEQLHEIVLDLDVVVGARQTQPGCCLEGVARLVVELADQASEIHVHGCARFIASTPSRRRPGRTARSKAKCPSRVTWAADRRRRAGRAPRRRVAARAALRSRTGHG